MNTLFHKRAPWIVLGAILCALAWAWIQSRQKTQSHARVRFEENAGRTERALQARLQTVTDLLHQAAEFASSQSVEPASWSRYVNSLDLDRKLPALDGIGYAAYLHGERRLGRLKITPPGRRFDYMVVQVFEPAPRPAELLGFDLGSDLTARVAAERARDGQTAALSGRLNLPDDAEHRVFLIFYPLFEKEDLRGWVFARFREENLLKGVIADGAALRLQAYDGPSMTRDALFFDTAQATSAWQKPFEAPISAVKGLQFGGRSWTLNFASLEKPAIAPPIDSAAMPLVAALCVVGMGMVGAWMWVNRQAEKVAVRMLAGMRLRETALSLGPHGIILADATQPDFPIVYVNRAFEKITGYSAAEVAGKNCRFLAGTDRDQKGLDELRRAIREQRDCRVLLRNYRRDGSPFWNDLYLSPVRNDMGRVVQYVGIQQDVTEREQAARRMATEAAIIRALAESPSLVEAAPRILTAICEAQEWDLGTFWRLDARTNTLQCVDEWHPVDMDLTDFVAALRGTTVARDVGVAGHVWAKGEQVLLPDLSRESRYPEVSLATQAGLTSACGFPIASRRGLQGVLVFYSRRIWPLSKNLLLLMVSTGAQISQFMEREQTEIEQKELSILERGLAEFMGEGLLAMDREGYFIYVNATAGRMLGYSPRLLLGQNAHDVLHPAVGSWSCLGKECPLLLSLQSTQSVHVDAPDAIFRRKDRDAIPVAYTTSPIVDRDLIQGVVVTFVDATARRAEEQALRQALADKEQEIARIQQMLAQPKDDKNDPNPSDLLVDKIRKLLG